MIKYELNLLDDFHKRLLELINSLSMTDEELSKELSIAKGTARDSWFAKGNYPPADKIKILLTLSNGKYSASWLFGEEVKTSAFENFPPEVKMACLQTKKIIEAKHQIITPALLANLSSFEHSIDMSNEVDLLKTGKEENKKEIKRLKVENSKNKKKIDDLTKEIETFKQTHCAGQPAGIANTEATDAGDKTT